MRSDDVIGILAITYALRLDVELFDGGSRSTKKVES